MQKSEKTTELLVASVTKTTWQTIHHDIECCDDCFAKLGWVNALDFKILWWMFLIGLGAALFWAFTRLPATTHWAVYIIPFAVMGVAVYLVGPWLVSLMQDYRIDKFPGRASTSMRGIRTRLREDAKSPDSWSINMRVARQPFPEPR